MHVIIEMCKWLPLKFCCEQQKAGNNLNTHQGKLEYDIASNTVLTHSSSSVNSSLSSKREVLNSNPGTEKKV
jgi:hypothetical protein